MTDTPKPAISEEQRERLSETLKALEDAHDAIFDAMAPYLKADRKITETTCAMLEQYGIEETLGRCEFCERLLLPGDKGHRADEGTLCDACSPTWAELHNQYLSTPEDERDEDWSNGMMIVESAIAQGRGGERHIWVLG